MPLVDYSDSETSEPTPPKPPQNKGTERKRINAPQKDQEPSLPPLPSTFHDLYASTTRVSSQDDPTLHGGRQRVTPHIEGSWPTHVYIECKSPLPLLVSLVSENE